MITKQLYIPFFIILFSISFWSCFIYSNKVSHHDIIQTKAATFLWEKQNTDGGWHSETHGIMKSGQSVSAFVFYNLLQVPDSIYHPTDKQINSALDFLRTHSKEGVLGNFESLILDYPNYATAYALRIFKHFDKAEDQVLIQQMKDYLLSQQFIEHRGMDENHLAYGAWGFGEQYLEDGTHGHVDLSHTRRILQSLQLLEDNELSNTLKKSQTYLGRLQKRDAQFDKGFFASTVTVSTNKGDLEDEQSESYRSYATATADGLLALIASGADKNDEYVMKAFQWLVEHPNIELPEGIPKDDPNQWHRVMFYYHLAVRAQAYEAMDYFTYSEAFVNVLLQNQNENGSFSNPVGAANKEDDPLIATSFALQVLESVK